MINIGIVGLGYWGPSLLRTFNQLSICRVKCCCELNADTRQAFQQRYPYITFTPNYDQLLLDPDLDAIVIATPVPTHYPLAKKALDHDKHVFVEKPLTLDLDQAVELTEISEQKKLTLMVGHLMLYHPAVETLKQMIENGDLGKIYYLYSQRVNLGRIRPQENAMWSLAPHDFSMVMYLIGQQLVSVSARGAAYLQPGIEDVVFVNLEFQDHIMAHIHCSWLDPHKIRKLTIVGENRMVVFDDMQPNGQLTVYNKGFHHPLTDDRKEFLPPIERFGDIWIPHIAMEEPLLNECRHFIESINTSKRPRSDGRNGISILKLLKLATTSIQQDGMKIPA